MKFALLEGEGFWIDAYSGDGERFVVQFRRCWERIPKEARQQILAYWRRPDHHLPVSFELSNMWGASEYCHAQVKSAGVKLRFNAESFLDRPELASQYTIAHELAHVYRWAIGEKRLDEFESEWLNETLADGWAMHWGFGRAPSGATETDPSRKSDGEVFNPISGDE